MGLVPIFTGHVTTEGTLVLAEREAVMRKRHLQSLAGKDVEVVVRRRREQRSLDQSKYLHAVPFRLLSEEWGEDIETTKLLVLGACFGWHQTKDGHRFPLKPSTSSLTVEEGSQLINFIPPWAMTEFGVAVPLPHEAE